MAPMGGELQTDPASFLSEAFTRFTTLPLGPCLSFPTILRGNCFHSIPFSALFVHFRCWRGRQRNQLQALPESSSVPNGTGGC